MGGGGGCGNKCCVQATGMLVGGLTSLLSGQLPDRAPPYRVASHLPQATLQEFLSNHCKNFEVVGWYGWSY